VIPILAAPRRTAERPREVDGGTNAETISAGANEPEARP
jgi:hypothetical protein